MSDKHKWIFDEIRRDLGWTVADWSVFKQGSPFKHLARENTQNTLDYRLSIAQRKYLMRR